MDDFLINLHYDGEKYWNVSLERKTVTGKTEKIPFYTSTIAGDVYKRSFESRTEAVAAAKKVATNIIERRKQKAIAKTREKRECIEFSLDDND